MSSRPHSSEEGRASCAIVDLPSAARSMLRSSLLGSALPSLLLSCVLPAQVHDFQGIRYSVPEGWVVVPSSANQLVLRKPQAEIAVVTTAWRECDLSAVVTAALESALSGHKITKRGEIQLGRTAEGFAFANQTIDTRDKNKGRNRYQFLAVHAHDRLLVFCLAVHDLLTAEEHARDFDIFLRDFDVPERKEDQRPSARAKPGQTFDPTLVLKDENARRKPGIVSGRVYDSLGRLFAVPGATVAVIVWGTTFAGDRSHYKLEVDPNGHFEQELPKGLYRIQATAYLPFEGTVLPCELHELDEKPCDLNQNSTAGIVKDYILRLSGPRAGGPTTHGYHGGWLCLADGALAKDVFAPLVKRYPAGSILRLVLDPKGPLADGTQGERIVIAADLEKMGTGAGDTRLSIPYARYVARAAIVIPGGREVALFISEGMAVAPGSGRSCEFAYRPDKNTANDSVAQIFLAVSDS